MKLLFDLNVLIDVACRWQRFPASVELFRRAIAEPTWQVAWPLCGYTTLYYVASQLIPEQKVRQILKHFHDCLLAIPFDEKCAQVALRLQMSDLEDACIAATALEGGCDVIATRNVDDFSTSPIAAHTPDALLERMAQHGPGV